MVVVIMIEPVQALRRKYSDDSHVQLMPSK
jgi:hypothetical protein